MRLNVRILPVLKINTIIISFAYLLTSTADSCDLPTYDTCAGDIPPDGCYSCANTDYQVVAFACLGGGGSVDISGATANYYINGMTDAGEFFGYSPDSFSGPFHRWKACTIINHTQAYSGPNCTGDPTIGFNNGSIMGWFDEYDFTGGTCGPQ